MRDGATLARQATRDVIAISLLSGVFGGGVVYALIQLTARGGAWTTDDRVSIAVAVPYAVLSSVLAYGGFALSFRRSISWLADERVPTQREGVRLLYQPAILALLSFAFWLGGALVFGLMNSLVFHAAVARSVQVTVTTILGGLTSCMICFLAVERRLRPLFTIVLSGEPPPRPATLGVRPLLLLSWALGSGVSLLALVLLPVAFVQHGRPHLIPSIVLLAVVGLVAGVAMTLAAARAVADPLEQVRAALARVQEGDLSVTLAVNDAGEIGMLQAGVNDMVAGLRERMLYRELLDHHIGDEVASYAIEHGVGLTGEVREVSALFIDVIGSTRLASDHAAADVVSLLNELFAIVVRAVSTEGGWINKFEGDAALCVFGAPNDQPDHAARALRAARCLRDSVREWGKLDAAVGVSSGTAVAGNVGSEERYEYTVIGDPVNEAARLSEVAKSLPERVAASGTTVAAAGSQGAWVAAGEQVLRGRTSPTEIFVAPQDSLKIKGIRA